MLIRLITLCLVALTSIPSAAAGPIEPRPSRDLAATPSESSDAPAQESRSAVEERVAEQVRRALPENLSLGQVQVAGELPWREGAVMVVKWPSSARAGQMSVLVSSRLGERELGRTWARVEIKQGMRIVTATHALNKGDVLRASDIAVTERATTSTTQPEVEAEALAHSLVGVALLHEVAAGQSITSADAELPAPAATGAPVRVLVRRHGLTISAAGVLERPLRPGEVGRARLITGHRVVTGLLVDAGTLVVDALGGALAGNLGANAP